MTFVSYAFVAFFFIVLGLNGVLRGRSRTWMLIAASYTFYGWWDWRFLGLIILSTVIDFICGRALDKERFPEKTHKERKRILTVSVSMNLLMLGFFKYFGFFVDSAKSALGEFPLPLGLDTLEIVLPVGISFYTFQTMSYTIDVFRGHMRSARRLDDFMLFVAFFPQLVAGPIERARHLLPQIENPRKATPAEASSGLELIALGFFYKMVVADNMAPYVNTIFHDPDPGGAAIWSAAFIFFFQIYGDFAGYSLIARGTARVLGYDIVPNFRMPWLSQSPSEFWLRWHISLSSWLRDYLYIPLGGNRGGQLKLYRNLALTMLLGGLWHGAAWTYVIWGAFQGTILVIYRLIKDVLDKLRPARSHPIAKRAFLGVFFFMLNCVGWIIFRSEDGEQLRHFLHTSVTSLRPGEVSWSSTARLLLFALPMMLIDTSRAVTKDLEPWTRLPAPARAAFVLAMVYAVFLLGTPYSVEFLYFQF